MLKRILKKLALETARRIAGSLETSELYPAERWMKSEGRGRIEDHLDQDENFAGLTDDDIRWVAAKALMEERGKRRKK